MPTTKPRNRRAYMKDYMQARRAVAHPDAKRYRVEAVNLLTTGSVSLRPFVALVIWQAARSGYKPAVAALADPTVYVYIDYTLRRAWAREVLGWSAVLKSLAASTTSEVRRVAKLVDQAAEYQSSRTA